MVTSQTRGVISRGNLSTPSCHTIWGEFETSLRAFTVKSYTAIRSFNI